jgi:hypothetical protein
MIGKQRGACEPGRPPAKRAFDSGEFAPAGGSVFPPKKRVNQGWLAHKTDQFLLFFLIAPATGFPLVLYLE